MDFKKIAKAIGPLFLLAIPVIIIVAIFSDSHYGTGIEEDGAGEAEVTYSLAEPERYGLVESEEAETTNTP